MSTLLGSEWPEVEGVGRMEHHEAGHAVVAMSFGFRVWAISTTPADSADATTYIELPSAPTNLDHVKMALVACAGIAAEFRFCRLSGKTNVSSASHFGDQIKAYASMDALGHGRLFGLYMAWVDQFLCDPRVWDSVTRLVGVLPVRGILNDPAVIASIACTVPAFEGEIFERTLSIIEEAKSNGILLRYHDSQTV